MHIKNMVICVIVISVLLIGCMSEKKKEVENIIDNIDRNQENKKPENDQLATKEFLMKTFQLTEEEIEPYQIVEVISYFKLTENLFIGEIENLENLSDITRFFEVLQEKMETDILKGNTNFYYLIDAENYEGDFPDIETIKYLAVSDQVGTGGRSFVMDFEKNLIYDSYKGAEVYRDITYAEKKIELDENKQAEIIQALKDAKIWEWEYMYSDDSEAGLESWWHLGIEFENGIVISYNGTGMVPDNYTPLEEILFKR